MKLPIYLELANIPLFQVGSLLGSAPYKSLKPYNRAATRIIVVLFGLNRGTRQYYNTAPP